MEYAPRRVGAGIGLGLVIVLSAPGGLCARVRMCVRVGVTLQVVGLYQELQSAHELMLALSTNSFCEPLLVHGPFTHTGIILFASAFVRGTCLHFQLLL